MTRNGSLAMAATALALAFTTAEWAAAAEIRLFGAEALRPVLSELTAEFERGSGHKLSLTFGTAGAVKKRFEEGEYADLIILTLPQIADLVKQGKLAADGRAIIARVGVGIAVRTGAAKPDLASTDSFKRSMLAAKSVLSGDPARGGAAAIHFAGVLERLGIAGEMKPKWKLHQGTDIAETVAKGEAELGVTQISLIVGVPGVELAGPLPAELQNYTVFSAGIAANAKEPDGAKAVIKMLSGSAAAAVIKAKGMEPGGN